MRGKYVRGQQRQLANHNREDGMVVVQRYARHHRVEGRERQAAKVLHACMTKLNAVRIK